MTRTTEPGRGVFAALAGIVALASMVAVLLISGASEGHAESGHAHAAAPTSKQLALHDGMRGLWEQHVAWTRLAIVAFAAGAPDLQATEARLLRNQVDIGNAVKPFYGRTAGNQLTKLLTTHITGAVALLQAAKSGDAAAIAKAKSAWYANGRQVADFLHAANPRNWSRADMRSMMKVHLDQTLAEAVDELTGKYAAGVREYDAIETHIIEMADMLSSGIAKQFPARLR
jgi:hypothetical protein